MRGKIFIYLLIGFLCSCKKDNNSDPNTPPSDFNLVDPTIILPNDAFGILHNSILNIEIEVPGFSDSIATAILGKARAYFLNDIADTAFINAGCGVSLGSYSLSEQTDHSYIYKQTSADSLIFRNSISWGVPCKSIDKIIQYSDFPIKPDITSDKNIYRLVDYTATHTAITGADSIVYQLQTTTTSRTRVIQKTLAGNSTSCTFAMSDMSKLDATYYALLTVTGYKIASDIYSGKKYYTTFQQSTSKLVFVY